jgi:putative SOS response-associated peptidase YedK
MCANFTPTRGERLFQQLGGGLPDMMPYKDECYPGYSAPLIRRATDNSNTYSRQIDIATFGLVPSWAALKLARVTYNARIETVATKPAYRAAWRRSQFCVIPIENFFEPSYETGVAERWQISHADGLPLAVAGLWEWCSHGGNNNQAFFSFTMLTMNADQHPLMRRFHRPEDEKRMIVLLEPNQIDPWLQASYETAFNFLHHYDADRLIARPAPKLARVKKNTAMQQMNVTPSLFDFD